MKNINKKITCDLIGRELGKITTRISLDDLALIWDKFDVFPQFEKYERPVPNLKCRVYFERHKWKSDWVGVSDYCNTFLECATEATLDLIRQRDDEK